MSVSLCCLRACVFVCVEVSALDPEWHTTAPRARVEFEFHNWARGGVAWARGNEASRAEAPCAFFAPFKVHIVVKMSTLRIAL